MHHQRVGEFNQQARRHDHIVWVTRIPNWAVDVVSRPQTPILRAEPIERSIRDGCDWLRRKRLQSKLSGRPSSGFHGPYRDRPIGVGAVFRVVRIYPQSYGQYDELRALNRYPETNLRQRTKAPEDCGFRAFQIRHTELEFGSVLLALCLIRRRFPHDCRTPLRWIMRLMVIVSAATLRLIR
jgi:hypothetical protein